MLAVPSLTFFVVRCLFTIKCVGECLASCRALAPSSTKFCLSLHCSCWSSIFRPSNNWTSDFIPLKLLSKVLICLVRAITNSEAVDLSYSDETLATLKYSIELLKWLPIASCLWVVMSLFEQPGDSIRRDFIVDKVSFNRSTIEGSALWLIEPPKSRSKFSELPVGELLSPSWPA